MNRGQRVPLGEKGSGSNSRPVMFKVLKICLMAWSQSLRTIPAHCSSARCPEHKTPRARAGSCVGKENGHVGRVAFPLLVTQHAQSWRQGLSIWCVLSTDKRPQHLQKWFWTQCLPMWANIAPWWEVWEMRWLQEWSTRSARTGQGQW